MTNLIPNRKINALSGYQFVQANMLLGGLLRDQNILK